jgi:hypothetical protein
VNFLRKSFEKLSVFLLALFAPAFFVYAASSTCEDGKICNPINADTIQGFIKTFLEGAIRVGLPILALAIIYCGFQFVQARGNSEKLNDAKQSLLYTLIGAALLLGAWAIAQIISNTVLSL